MSNVKIFDADILVPELQEIKVGGRVFKIGKIPMRISIKIYESMSKKDNSNIESLTSMASVITDVLKLDDNKMTKDWVIDNVDIRQVAPLFTEICEMMSRVATKKPVEEVQE